MKTVYSISTGDVLTFCPGPVPALKAGQALHKFTETDEATFAANKGSRFRIVDGALVASGLAVGPVPREVPLWAFRQILIEDGLLETIVSDLSSDPILLNFLEYGNFVTRSSPALKALATKLGKTDLEVDEVFRRARKIKV